MYQKYISINSPNRDHTDQLELALKSAICKEQGVKLEEEFYRNDHINETRHLLYHAPGSTIILAKTYSITICGHWINLTITSYRNSRLTKRLEDIANQFKDKSAREWKKKEELDTARRRGPNLESECMDLPCKI